MLNELDIASAALNESHYQWGGGGLATQSSPAPI